MKYILRFIGVLRCMIRLGPWQAFKLLFLAPRMQRKFSIRVREFSRPIVIRGKTSDYWVLNQIIVCGEYSEFVLNPPGRILDGGANIGLATLYWSNVFPDTKIVAVEPDIENFKLLTENTQHLNNVTPIHAGLWARSTRLAIKYLTAEKYAIQVIEDEKGTIDAFSIASIMKQQDWDWVDVVKLDVEGSEVAILAENCSQWIDKIGTLILEIHQDIAPDAARVLFRAFADQDFHLSWRGENLILRRDGRRDNEK